MDSNFPTIDLRVVYVAPTDLSKQFKFKDTVDEIEKQSLVVYYIKCKDCNADYIGKTERLLFHRIKEHKTQKTSSIYQHQLSTGHTIDYDNVQILDRADSDRKLQLKEVMHIDKRKPSLNIQLNSQTQYRIGVHIIGSSKV